MQTRSLVYVVAIPLALLMVSPGQSATQPSPRPFPEPLVIDVKGDGYQLSSAADGVSFDLTGSGTALRVGWTTAGSDDAFLAIDENHNGRIAGGYELLGGTSGPPNGFAALAAYDGFLTRADFAHASNRRPDGVITPTDTIFSRLLLWTDTNHNGVSEEDELESLSHAGITKLYLGYKDISFDDGLGNVLHYQAQASRTNGAGVEVLRPVTAIRFSAQ